MKKGKIEHVLVIPTWYPIGTDKLLGQYHRDFTESLNKYGNVKANMLYIQREMISKPIKYLFLPKHETIKENGYFTEMYRMISLQAINEILQLECYTKKLYSCYKKYVKKYGKPDCIHAHVTIPAGYAATYIGVKENIPVVVTEHGSFNSRFFKGKYKKYSDFVLENATFTVVSNKLKDILEIDNKSNIKILPNGVDISNYAKVKNKTLNDTLDLIQVCALRKTKRTDLILDAIKILKEKYGYKNIHLTVLGDGFDTEEIKQDCLNKKMMDYVSFEGKKNKEEMAKYYSKVDIAVIASDFETFAIPGIEALAAKVPLVSTKCGGPEEYIDENCGCLATVNDAESLASAINHVYKKIDKYDRNYLLKVAEKYSDASVVKLTMDYYNKNI